MNNVSIKYYSLKELFINKLDIKRVQIGVKKNK